MHIRPFDFEDGGRTYTCRVEKARSTATSAWWWFGVSGDAQRYAPFLAAPDDTEDAIRARIIAYYDNLLARRAMPAEPRQPYARRGVGGRPVVAAVAAPAADADAAPVVAEE
jgi:hypothetical protein